MMRSDPHPSSTAEKSKFSMIAVTAIHQRLANAVARVGAMVDWEKKVKDRSKKQEERDLGDKERKGERRCSWKCRKNLPD